MNRNCMIGQYKTGRGIQRPGLRTRSKQLKAWIEYRNTIWHTREVKLFLTSTGREEDAKSWVQGIRAGTEFYLQTAQCETNRSSSNKAERDIVFGVSKVVPASLEQVSFFPPFLFCIRSVFCSFKSRWTELQEVGMNLKKVTERCKKIPWLS